MRIVLAGKIYLKTKDNFSTFHTSKKSEEKELVHTVSAKQSKKIPHLSAKKSE